MSLSDVFDEYEKVPSMLKSQEVAQRTSANRMKAWQLWGWLMTLKLARLTPDATIEMLDLVIRRTPRIGFGQGQVEKMFLLAESSGMLNAMGGGRALRDHALHRLKAVMEWRVAPEHSGYGRH